jgi:hypothetical protein
VLLVINIFELIPAIQIFEHSIFRFRIRIARMACELTRLNSPSIPNFLRQPPPPLHTHPFPLLLPNPPLLLHLHLRLIAFLRGHHPINTTQLRTNNLLELRGRVRQLVQVAAVVLFSLGIGDGLTEQLV